MKGKRQKRGRSERGVADAREIARAILLLSFAFCLFTFAFLVACAARPRGPLAYVTNERDGTITVIDTATDRVVSTFNVGGRLRGVRVGPDGARVYVATGRGNTVDVVDAKTFDVVAEIPTGQRPWGLAITPDGKKVYAACGMSNEVSVIDTATNRVVASVKAGDGPWGVAISNQ